jgi:hypothetical protein
MELAIKFANWISINNWAPTASGGLWKKYTGNINQYITRTTEQLFKEFEAEI